MVPRCGKDLCEGLNRGNDGSIEHGEVEVGRVAVLTNVGEAKSSSALEDKTSAISHIRPVEMRDYVGENVVPLHKGRIDSIGISASSDLMPSEH